MWKAGKKERQDYLDEKREFQKMCEDTNERRKGRGRERVIEKEDETEITDEGIEAQIKKLKRKKAMGEDGIKNEAWIYSEGNTRKELRKILKEVWAGKSFLEDWKKRCITTLHKKGDQEDAANYRGISLLCTAYKIYAAVLNEKLKEEIEKNKILPETQAGFRKGRGTMDSAYILHHIIQRETTKKRGKVYAFFVDLKAAFDSVKREQLWEQMFNRGIEKGLIEAVREIYQETSSVVKVNKGETEKFWTVFTILIADMEKRLKKNRTGGIKVFVYISLTTRSAIERENYLKRNRFSRIGA
ncbi:PREDICTED: uncharacterized protein LOC107195037 [Dufourea novaeangliae]|uniref:uncharacterized protein LOC107195037 n=1 Tax=Dufourea novaeangliae TaxID=178035 RepID=UPI0007674C76|nr:PREDICTED: uncharacterized protein LOC107195037 [Dufourea novaeangliae]